MGMELRVGQLREGVWGQHTALIDWCEQNYQVSSHVAEFWNTLSNIPFMGMAIFGVYKTLHHGLPARFAASYLGMGLVGLGSFWFHATLKWEAQLCDELPMIWFSSYMMWSAFDSSPGFSVNSSSILSLVGLFSTLIALTHHYVSHPNPVHHQLLFGFILISTALRTTYLIRQLPSSQAKVKNAISTMFAKGVASFVLGFAAWNADNLWCDTLESWRERLPFFIGALLQFHSWWHALTGLGVFLMVTSSNCLLTIVKSEGQGRTFTMVEKPLCLPYVREVSKKSVNGHASSNGHSNGNGKKLH
ncbi:ceramidase [Mrakia frigida]|uniref:ceramidase n=1 Tax=Mrakia frigida TaxID=29902 RepID=UPI003FCBFC03